MTNNNSKIIDGVKIATNLSDFVAGQVELLKKSNIIPGLAVILIGNNPASRIYVERKKEMARAVGMISHVIELEENISEKNLINKIHHLNNDPKINGILVQLPLPKHIDPVKVTNEIDPIKDVDGLTHENIGKLITQTDDALIPCTPQGCMILIRTIQADISGMNAVVIGRSNIVGRPMVNLLINNNATTTLVHSYSDNPQKICSQADIIISAAGVKGLVKEDWVKDGAIVIDVAINRYISDDGKIKLCGDVDFDKISKKARAITPVPGGVGPMTIACLLKNTVKATCLQRNINFQSNKQ